jgi:hypothetical protein
VKEQNRKIEIGCKNNKRKEDVERPTYKETLDNFVLSRVSINAIFK